MPCPDASELSLSAKIPVGTHRCQQGASGMTAPEVSQGPKAPLAPPLTSAGAPQASCPCNRIGAVPMAPTFARVVTAGGYRNNTNAHDFAKVVKNVVLSPPLSQGLKMTRFVVAHNSGVDDEHKEWALWEGDPPVGHTLTDRYKSSAAKIVLAICSDIEKQVVNPICIIDSAWCHKASSGGPPEYMGNFSFTVTGVIPFGVILTYHCFFIKYLLKGDLVPGEKWVHVHI